MLFGSSAVPRTMRRCIFRPSSPPSRHLKHQTSGPRLRRSTVTLPSCIACPFPGRLKQGDMLTGVINLPGPMASKARLNAALRRQHSRVVNNESEELPNQSPQFPSLPDFLILWKAYSSPKRIASGLPIRPGIGRNANGALEFPQDQFAVGGKNQVLRILHNADKRRQLFVSQRDHRIDAHGPPRRKVAGENACHKH